MKLTGTVSRRRARPLFAVAHYGSNNMITLRYRLKDLKVQAAEKAFKQGDVDVPGGLVRRSPATRRARRDRPSRPSASRRWRSPTLPDVPMHDLDLPRVAVYSTWGSTQDVGWVRYAFDKFEVPFDLIYKDRVRQGNLRCGVRRHRRSRTRAGSGKRLVFDIESRGKPIDYKKSDEFKNLGHVRRVGRHHRRHGTRGRRRVREVRRRRAACW